MNFQYSEMETMPKMHYQSNKKIEASEEAKHNTCNVALFIMCEIKFYSIQFSKHS